MTRVEIMDVCGYCLRLIFWTRETLLRLPPDEKWTGDRLQAHRCDALGVQHGVPDTDMLLQGEEAVCHFRYMIPCIDQSNRVCSYRSMTGLMRWNKRTLKKLENLIKTLGLLDPMAISLRSSELIHSTSAMNYGRIPACRPSSAETYASSAP